MEVYSTWFKLLYQLGVIEAQLCAPVFGIPKTAQEEIIVLEQQRRKLKQQFETISVGDISAEEKKELAVALNRVLDIWSYATEDSNVNPWYFSSINPWYPSFVPRAFDLVRRESNIMDDMDAHPMFRGIPLLTAKPQGRLVVVARDVLLSMDTKLGFMETRLPRTDVSIRLVDTQKNIIFQFKDNVQPDSKLSGIGFVEESFNETKQMGNVYFFDHGIPAELHEDIISRAKQIASQGFFIKGRTVAFSHSLQMVILHILYPFLYSIPVHLMFQHEDDINRTYLAVYLRDMWSQKQQKFLEKKITSVVYDREQDQVKIRSSITYSRQEIEEIAPRLNLSQSVVVETLHVSTWTNNRWPTASYHFAVASDQILLMSDQTANVIRLLHIDPSTPKFQSLVKIAGEERKRGECNRQQILFESPSGIAVDRIRNHVYVADFHAHRIYRLKLETKVEPPRLVFDTRVGETSFDKEEDLWLGGSNKEDTVAIKDAKFNNPHAVAVDADPEKCLCYVADMGNGAVRCIDFENKMVSTVIDKKFAKENGVPNFQPIGLAFSSILKRLFIATGGDAPSILCLELTESKRKLTIIAGSKERNHADGPGATARFRDCNGLTLNDKVGLLFVADTGNHCIRAITANFEKEYDIFVATVVGKHGQSGDTDGDINSALLSYPVALAAANDRLYVAELESSRVRCCAWS